MKFCIAKFTFDPAGAKRMVNSYSKDGGEMLNFLVISPPSCQLFDIYSCLSLTVLFYYSVILSLLSGFIN